MHKLPTKSNMRLRLHVKLFNPFFILKPLFSAPLPFFLVLINLSFLLQLIELLSINQVMFLETKVILLLILVILPFLSTLLLLCHLKRICTLPESMILLIVAFFLGVHFYILLFVMNSKFDLDLLTALLIWENALKVCPKKKSQTILFFPFSALLTWKLDLIDCPYPKIILFLASAFLVLIKKNMTIKKKKNTSDSESTKSKLDLQRTHSHNEQLSILTSLQDSILVFNSALKLQYANPSASSLIFTENVVSQSQIEADVLSLRQDENFLQLKGHVFHGEIEFTHLIKAFKSKMALFGSLVTEFNEETFTSNLSKKTIKSLVSAQMRIRQSRDTCKRLESWIERTKIKDSKETTHKEFKDVEKLKLKNLHFLNQNVKYTSRFLKRCNSTQEAKSMREILKSFFDLQLTNFHFFLHSKDPKTVLLVSLELVDGNALVLIKTFDRKDPLFSVWDMYEAQNKLLASMCHELRTPLNSITNMLELMENIEEDNESEYPNRTHNREYLSSAILNSKLLLSNINDFLDYFSFSGSIFELKAKSFNIRELLIECDGIFSPLAFRKMVNFFLHIPDLNSYMCCNDEERIKQIIINLLNNAFKFTSAGGTVILQLKSKPDSFEIVIRDTGVGIEPHKFKPLANFQEDQNKKGSPTLGGFGLTISNILSNYIGPIDENEKNYKGIKVRTEKDKGSRFSFLIDKKKSEIEDTESLEEITELERKAKNIDRFKKTHHDEYHFFSPDDDFVLKQVSSVKCKCCKILTVDDNEFNLFVLREQFKKHNLEIDTSSGGVEAVNLVEEILIDTSIKFCNKCRFYKLILMDIDMPVKDGYETTKEIHELLKDSGINVKIVALSAFSQEKAKEKAVQAGIVDYIEKPFSVAKMEYLIHKYLPVGFV